MAITNLNNVHLKEEEVTTALNALTDLETALETIKINLSAEDRQKYGSINEQNKLLVHKVRDYNNNEKTLSSPDVNWEEFALDFTSRQNYEGIIARLESLTNSLKNAKILHDYDNYQAALVDYDFTSYKAGTASPGFETKRTELRQFFTRTSKTTETPPSA